jgi:hypothetical protein
MSPQEDHKQRQYTRIDTSTYQRDLAIQVAKTAQLQIRVTAAQKARLKRLAAAAGQDVSAYVLDRVLPPERERFAEIMNELARGDDPRYALAELHDFLALLPPARFADAIEAGVPARLPPLVQNYVAAMVEHTAAREGARPPAWTREVMPLDEPYFAASLQGLRLHLLAASPVAFKRRNIFVDATVGDRV